MRSELLGTLFVSSLCDLALRASSLRVIASTPKVLALALASLTHCLLTAIYSNFSVMQCTSWVLIFIFDPKTLVNPSIK